MARLKNKTQKENLLDKEFDVILTGDDILYITVILGSLKTDESLNKIESYYYSICDIHTEKLIRVLKERIDENFISKKYNNFLEIAEEALKINCR